MYNIIVPKSIFIWFYILFQIREKCQELVLDGKTTEELMSRILVEVNRGLSKKTNAKADVRCYITYIQDLPNGKGILIFIAVNIYLC